MTHASAAPLPRSPVLTVRGLTKGFTVHHLGHRIAAFDALDLTVSAGEFILLRGANGVGKSTLLRPLYRSYLPLSGEALFASSLGEIDLATAADVDIAALRRTDIGFVTQFLVARPRVSAEALVAEPLRDAGWEAGAALEQARSWLETFGVRRQLWPAYPTTFSGGEQQKVNLARALILPRRLLLLDEPTASLDAQARAALVDRLAQLKANGVAMIGVFHHPQDINHLVDKQVVLTAPSAAAGNEDGHVAQ